MGAKRCNFLQKVGAKRCKCFWKDWKILALCYNNNGVDNNMDRKIYEDLVAWKNTENHKTLMVLGVRQSGKKNIIDEFCKKEYK